MRLGKHQLSGRQSSAFAVHPHVRGEHWLGASCQFAGEEGAKWDGGSSIFVSFTDVHVGHEMRCIESSESFFGHHQHSPWLGRPVRGGVVGSDGRVGLISDGRWEKDVWEVSPLPKAPRAKPVAAGDEGEASPPEGEFTSVSGGQYHSCGVRTDGTIACWGADYQGHATWIPVTSVVKATKPGPSKLTPEFQEQIPRSERVAAPMPTLASKRASQKAHSNCGNRGDRSRKGGNIRIFRTI